MRQVKLFTIFFIGIFCIPSSLYAQQHYTEADDIQLVAAFEHSLILHTNTVWSWGKYQDFNNEFKNITVPTITTNLDGIISVSEGCTANHTLVIKNDSSVWAWGNNKYGQVAVQNSKNEAFPVKVRQLKNIIQVAAGKGHSVALMADGTVWTWGWNEFGQLGLGDDADQNVARKVPNLKDVKAIAAGATHTLALKKDGTVWAWGRNNVGQLGNGKTEMVIRPESVLILEKVTSIAAGAYHNLALTADGKVFAWGWNDYGQVGSEVNSDRMIPVAVAIDNVKLVRAGTLHSIILKKDGTVWAWGDNTFGQTAEYKKDRIQTPRKINTLKNIQTISVGDMHNLALDKDGEIWAWGMNDNGRLGNSKSNGTIPSAAFNVNNLTAKVYFANMDNTVSRSVSIPASMKIYGLEEIQQEGHFEIPIDDDYLIDTMYHTIKIGDVLLEACPTEQALKKLTIHLACNQDSLVKLTWNLSAADDFYENFFLERSFNGMDWTEVETELVINIQAFETKFSIMDKMVFENKNTFYRLKQLNCDEDYVYSNIIKTGCFSNETDGHFKSKFTVSIDNPTRKSITFQLQDVKGNIIKRVILEDNKIAFSEGLDLKKGTYFMFLIDENLHHVMDSKKLIKVGK